MESEGSSAFNFAPAAEYNLTTSQFGGHQQLPPSPDSPELGYTSNDNYLVQVAQDVTFTPDFGSGAPHPHPNPHRPAVAGPAHPSNPAPVGFAPDGIHQQLSHPFVASHGSGVPPHQDDTFYNTAAYNNGLAWCPDDEAPNDDGSPFPFSESMQGHLSAMTIPAWPSVASPGERPHVCILCPAGQRRFASARDLQRHLDTSHQSDLTPKYFCWCEGRGRATARKDNHVRHVESCNRQPFPGSRYICICGKLSSDKHVHLSHVKKCGRTRTHHRH